MSDISNPLRIIAPTVMPIFISSESDTISGIAPLKPANAPPNKRLANNPAQMPCLAAVAMNGRIM